MINQLILIPDPEQAAYKAGVGEVDLGVLHDPLIVVLMIGRQSINEKARRSRPY